MPCLAAAYPARVSWPRSAKTLDTLTLPATSSSGSLRRPTTVTAAPRSASSRAVAAPIRVPAPVTSATLPSNEASVIITSR
jgi:hypothetical protein